MTDHRTRSDHGVVPNGYPLEHDAVVAQPDIVLDDNRQSPGGSPAIGQDELMQIAVGDRAVPGDHAVVADLDIFPHVDERAKANVRTMPNMQMCRRSLQAVHRYVTSVVDLARSPGRDAAIPLVDVDAPAQQDHV